MPHPPPRGTQGNPCPGEPICSVVPSDTCEDARWGHLSVGVGSGESLTSGSFGSSGGKGEMGVPDAVIATMVVWSPVPSGPA